jgi:hypothetical protein
MKAVATCVGVAERRPSSLARACEATHGFVVRPWNFTLGKTTGSEEADSDEASPNHKGGKAFIRAA